MKEEPLGIVIGTVRLCEKVNGTEHLHRLVIEIGDGRSVEIATGLPSFYSGNTLEGRQLPVKVDVKPATIHGVTSTARLIAIMAADGKPNLLVPERPVQNGDVVV